MNEKVVSQDTKVMHEALCCKKKENTKQVHTFKKEPNTEH